MTLDILRQEVVHTRETRSGRIVCRDAVEWLLIKDGELVDSYARLKDAKARAAEFAKTPANGNIHTD